MVTDESSREQVESESPPKERGQTWRSLGLTFLSHVPAVLTVGAIVLYLLGVVASIGQLRASDADVGQALNLIPLERHLRNGIAIALSPWTLFIVVMFPALAFVVSNPTESAPTGDTTVSPPFPRIYGWVALAVFLFICVVGPWTAIASLVLTAVCLFAPLIAAVKLGGYWRARMPTLYVLGGITATTLLAALNAYFLSDPLPAAMLQTSGRSVEAPLIAISEGVVYLAAVKPNGFYTAVPVAQVTNLSVVRRKRKPEPSPLNLIGIDWPPDQ